MQRREKMSPVKDHRENWIPQVVSAPDRGNVLIIIVQ